MSSFLLLLIDEEPRCSVVCTAEVVALVHVESRVVASASVSCTPTRVRLAYPTVIQCESIADGRPGGSIKGSHGLVAGSASIEVHAGAIRPQGTCSILGTASVVAAMVDVTIIGTADVTSDMSEPYGFILGRAQITAVPYAIHYADCVMNAVGSFGGYALVEHYPGIMTLDSVGDAAFVGLNNQASQVRMDGVARFRLIGTYIIDGSLNVVGKGDAVFQALLNFGGLLPSGSVRKSYVIDDAFIRFTSSLDVGLPLGAASRYLPVPLIQIGDDVLSMGPLRFPYISESPSDTFILVRNGEQYRLDRLSLRHYGTSGLWWVIAVSNGIRNPFSEPEVGTRLRIPALDRVYREIVGRTA